MISVIIPYKDAERFISRCANSLIVQDGDFEFIFVNDNFQDGGYDEYTLKKDFDDKRIVMLNNEHAQGVSGARNTGIEHARGEWLTFLDVDDVMLPNDGELYQRIMAEAEADIYQFNHYRYYVEISKRALKFTNPAGFYGMEHLPHQWFMVWNKIIRHDLLDDVRFKDGIQYGEDELFILDCLIKARKIYCSTEVGIMRYFDNKQSLSRMKTADDVLNQIINLTQFFIEHDDPEVRNMMFKILSEHWTSKTWCEAFGAE